MSHYEVACDESDGQWLPLTEFSVRSGISTSTIRRKIKSNTIKYKLENGRYLLLYRGEKAFETELRTAPAMATDAPVETTRTQSAADERAMIPLLDRSVKMVSDAYERTLSEKDERIRLLEKENSELRARVSELRTLVQALEEKYEVRY